MCFAAIHWAHIEKVFYCNTKAEAAAIGFDDNLITEIMIRKREDPIPFYHQPSKACQELFKRWYEDPHKVLY